MPVAVAAVVIGAVVALDRLTKTWFMQRPVTEGPFLVPGILETTKHMNEGLVANLAVPKTIILAVSIAVLVILGIVLYQAVLDREIKHATALSLIIGGAVGNVWDRFVLGYVFDWILLFGRSVINLADIAIGLGILVYLFSLKRAAAPALDAPPEIRQR